MAQATSRRAVTCLDCQYDLTGLPDEGVCPECGGRFSYSRTAYLNEVRQSRRSLRYKASRAHDWYSGSTLSIPKAQTVLITTFVWVMILGLVVALLARELKDLFW